MSDTNPRRLLRELRPMLHLAWPVVLAELGWMGMGVVDTVMVGRLGPQAIGAVSVGRVLSFVAIIFGIGLLLGLDTLVSQAFGSGRLEDCRRATAQGVWLAAALGPLLTLLIWLVSGHIDRLGVDPTVVPQAGAYTAAFAWVATPILLYAALRRYLQAIQLVRPVMLALISANLINVVANWLLIFGNLGLPRLGVAGAGWASVLSSVYLFGFLFGVVRLQARRDGMPWRGTTLRFDPPLLRRLLRLGLPAALQLVLEIAVFSLATLIVAGLDPISLAAHHVALTAASVTYMVPLGISAAAAVRVGHAIGRGDYSAAGQAGWSALLLGSVFMSFAALVFVLLPRQLIGIFSNDPRVLRTGVRLFYLAAAFQLFDGLQVVATGALRGSGDTRTPLLWNLVGYWLLGLPVGWLLCFRAGQGAAGMWAGLTLALTVVGAVLLLAWTRRVRTWTHTHPQA